MPHNASIGTLVPKALHPSQRPCPTHSWFQIFPRNLSTVLSCKNMCINSFSCSLDYFLLGGLLCHHTLHFVSRKDSSSQKLQFQEKNGRNIRARFRRVKWFSFSLKLFQITERARKLISAVWYYLVDVNN